ncbi:hypothetical protein [Amycolatopsis saalfeldensis]|uniref:Uncharacterized protein n=1 Tax=Amycolatopsis saalfeldensis TaxID=394193 RepID=A0A1H8Y3K7_9PSEU|nr:hypothetical protein [Amycolatopsis saalfeldensis]SEP46591.1 hypothetical protein SAMN04489732_110292 [Amycolatopsis saalfeldensis]
MNEPVDQEAARLRGELVGRQDGATLLYQAWVARRITRDGLRDLLPDAWTRADPSPEMVIGATSWVEMFREAGRLLLPTNYPALPDMLTIYRGAIHHRRRGMAWTTDCHKAAQFRRRREQTERTPAFLFRAEVALEAVLAAFNTRGEREIVVDPSFLKRIDRLD